MQVQSTPSVVRGVGSGPQVRRPSYGAGLGRRRTAQIVCRVDAVGYRVPAAHFTGRVHSVHARACNVAAHGTLLTLCAPGAAHGPLTLRLARGGPDDLRAVLEAGEPVQGGPHALRTLRLDLRWAQAAIWRPDERGALLSGGRIHARLSAVAVCLARSRGLQQSVLDGVAAPVTKALQRACRLLQPADAARHVQRLIGWGEGLTPSGDDFLVGLLAGLQILVQADPRRRCFVDALANAIVRGATRTTPIAAHFLRLAAAGDFAEPLVVLRHALVAGLDDDDIDPALRVALAVGATSGADTVSGLLAALSAWALPAHAAGAH